MLTKYYPNSPTSLPKNLTSLPSSYQFRAILAILAIILFFILYTAMVIAFGYLTYYAITYNIQHINKLTIVLKLGSILGAAMLFVFTLKFIFKLKNHKIENRKKLDSKKHKDLWNFIHQICKETGAPKPKAIYVDPDVNAYVSYSNMWLSLFLPVKKELTIGLGIVNCLNMSEFKAVISHEFGHFAQRSMKIGSYIISANTIIHGMIFTRDKWDDLLDNWRASDIRLSFAAWIITPIIWVIRQLLNLFYLLLNIMHSSLSREMEFNADKVAISTSGSDAIISALWKLDDGFPKWNQSINHLYMASKKNMYVKNIYTHNALDLNRNLSHQNELFKNLPDDKRGGKKYFSSHENSKVNMYASHPPNDARQENAKVPYIECKIDTSSPWILFTDDSILQEDLTKLIYKQYINKTPKEFVSTKEFENFIIAESKDRKLLEEYDHTFENRFFNIPPINDIVDYKTTSKSTFSEEVKSLKTELKSLMQPIHEINLVLQKAQQLAEGTLKDKFFTYNKITYQKKNLQEGYNKLITDREKLFEESFIEWDKKFCFLHFNEAKTKNKDHQLLDIYKQHIALTTLYRAIIGVKNKILTELETMQNTEGLTQVVVSQFGSSVKNYYSNLNHNLEELNNITFIPLPNIDNLTELKESIIENGKFERFTGNIFENGSFDVILNNLENTVAHCQRIEQKSVGKILFFLKEI